MNQEGRSGGAAPRSPEAFGEAIIFLGYVIFSTRVLRLMTSDPSDPDPFADKIAFFFFYAIVVILMTAQPQRLLALVLLVSVTIHRNPRDERPPVREWACGSTRLRVL